MLRREHVQSVLVVHQHDYSPFLDGANLLYLVVVNRPEPQWETKHLVFEGECIVEHQISQWQIESWAVHGADERVIYWLSQAEIVLDKNDYMKTMKERLLRLPLQTQKLRVCEEYSRFLRYYLEAKELLQQGFALDSYQAVLNALHSWARLVVYEANHQPEISIWMQVKQLDSSVYKLYEELIASNEPLEKRIELLLLPIEFSIMSKMKTCTQFLADILQSRNRPWSMKELLQLPELAKSQIDLHLLLEKMAKRSLVHEVLVPKESEQIFEKAYLLSG
jgi:hypothetical protein